MEWLPAPSGDKQELVDACVQCAVQQAVDAGEHGNIILNMAMTGIDVPDLAHVPMELRQFTNGLVLSYNDIGPVQYLAHMFPHLHTLILQATGLFVLPLELTRLRALRTLSVSDNQLTLPLAFLARCAPLETLVAHHCGLRHVAGVGYLSSLCTLELAHNELRALPLELAACGRLRRLDTRGNPLEWPPRSIRDRGDEAGTTDAGAVVSFARAVLAGAHRAGACALLLWAA